MTDTTVTTTAYLVVQGDRRKWGATNKDTGLRPIEGARVLAIRQNRPSGLTADQVAVRVRLVMPAAIFDPQAPVATITVPAELVQHPVIGHGGSHRRGSRRVSRRNPPTLTVGWVYTIDGRKRRWTLDAVDTDTGKVVLSSGDEWRVMDPHEANKRLKEVWT